MGNRNFPVPSFCVFLRARIVLMWYFYIFTIPVVYEIGSKDVQKTFQKYFKKFPTCVYLDKKVIASYYEDAQTPSLEKPPFH